MNLNNNIYYSLIALFIILLTLSCGQEKLKSHNVSQLKDNWYIQSSDSVTVSGSRISSGDYRTSGWYQANVPSTVLHSLANNGVYDNFFLDDNLKHISGEPFKSSWWYRTTFNIDKSDGATLLHFKGINYKANIWINGVQIADTSLVKNAFRQFHFDISDNISKGENVIAVEVFPPVKGDFTIGFVDWNPAPPDNNMGLFRGVIIETNGGVGISNPFVVSNLNNDLSEATLTASVEITNYTNVKQAGEVLMTVNGNKIVKNVGLKPNETKRIHFDSKEFKQLFIKNPKLWWPKTLGQPNLYSAGFEFRSNGVTIDKKSVDFGIRTVSSFLTEDGHRGFMINGKKILIRGGGWVDRLLLDDTRESIKNQLEYVNDMNLNTIRLEGFWGKDQTLYNLCDKMGILIMVGWSCQWEWEDYLGKYCDEEFGGILSPSDIDMMSKAWQDQIISLRNHPSIFAWVGGSDCKPKPELEEKYMKTFSEYDSTRVYLPSAKEWSSTAGRSGVKMRGPYAYVPPVYWFADTLYGGAFGFNTETGPGAQVPPLESIKKMISNKHLWPVDSVWDYHCGRHEFNNLNRYTKALEKRYGKATSIEEYTKKAQVLNYELMRPMFEAFSAYRYKATGVIQWMLNSAWPEMYWQLYDYYLMPNGAYYGAKKASQPYHIIYDYSSHSLYAVNDRLEDKTGCTLRARIFDANSNLKFEKEIKIDLKANSGREILIIPKLNMETPVYFLDTRLTDNSGKVVDINFYWLSAKEDILDYQAEVPGWYYHTPSKQYADFAALNDLPEAEVTSTFSKEVGNDFTKFLVRLKNNENHIAFFIHSKIVDKESKSEILPVLWSDNYISLLPGESRTLTAMIKNNYLKSKIPVIEVEGYNLKKKDK